MGKVTSKLQVTVPKVIAERYAIRPGDDIEWVEAGDTIRIVPRPRHRRGESATMRNDRAMRLRLFDEATERQRAREAVAPARPASKTRGWKRADLYGERGRSR